MGKKKATQVGRAMNTKDWLDLEHLVASIQRELAPAAKVEHNVRIKGRNSEVDRQVDQLVTQNIGQYAITIAIDCKDYKTPVDAKGVEFAGMVNDICVNNGVLVCLAGFTETDFASVRIEFDTSHRRRDCRTFRGLINRRPY